MRRVAPVAALPRSGLATTLRGMVTPGRYLPLRNSKRQHNTYATVWQCWHSLYEHVLHVLVLLIDDFGQLPSVHHLLVHPHLRHPRTHTQNRSLSRPSQHLTNGAINSPAPLTRHWGAPHLTRSTPHSGEHASTSAQLLTRGRTVGTDNPCDSSAPVPRSNNANALTSLCSHRIQRRPAKRNEARKCGGHPDACSHRVLLMIR